MITKLDHVMLTVPSAAAGQVMEFYQSLLGFKLTDRPSSIAHIPGIWLKSGDAELHFGFEEGIDRLKTHAHPAFTVDKLPLIHERIVELGGTIIPTIPIPGRARIEFRDPFENRVELVQHGIEQADFEREAFGNQPNPPEGNLAR